MPGQTGQQIGGFLRALRMTRQFTLRKVERLSGVSNAYISQIEQGKIAQPSPHILQKLASCYGVAAADLMRKAGYITESVHTGSSLAPAAANRSSSSQRGQVKRPVALSSALGSVTPDEENELLKYLAFLRSRNK
jgi:HTH-type transcriptional regulator, competence development regulator